MSINVMAVAVASVLEFVAGFVWYGPLFGKLWGRIHGFDKLSKAVQQKMMSAMGPIYVAQFGVTIITTVVLAWLLQVLPGQSSFALTLVLWLGFVVPTQASTVFFGGTEGKWILTKLAVLAGGSFVSLQVAAAVLQYMG